MSWRWMLALSALNLAMLSGGVAAHRGFESPFFVGYYASLAMFAVGGYDGGGRLRSALPRSLDSYCHGWHF